MSRRTKATGIWVLAVLVAPLLAGCSTSPAQGYLAIYELGSFFLTEKTLGDHAVSAITGKDCYSIRVERGRTYCVEDESPPPGALPPVYCHETLGDVTCYRQADPYNQGAQPVEHVAVSEDGGPVR